MNESTTACPGTFPAPVPTNRDIVFELRRACAEMLLAGGLLLSDVQRDKNWNGDITKNSEDRFRKALELAREALS